MASNIVNDGKFYIVDLKTQGRLCVAVIPDFWLHDTNFCYYPDKRGDIACAKREQPNSTWLNYRCGYRGLFVKNPRLPVGLRLDPFVSTKRDNGMFRIVIVNETNHTISLSRYTILGHVVFEPPTLIASCSTNPTTIDPAIFEASLPDVTETIKGELRKLLLENKVSSHFKHVIWGTRDWSNTLYRHSGARAHPPKAIQSIPPSTGSCKENHRRTTSKQYYTTLPLPLGGPNSVKTSVQYLGHVISADGVAPDPAKIKCLVNYKKPLTVKEMQSFLGLASYYRRFIKGFSIVAHPLIHQAKGKPQDMIKWGPTEEKSFEFLRKCLMTDPVLAYPDFTKEFLIYTDAIDYGLVAVLFQIHDRKDQPIAYASRHLNKAKTKYSTIEKEAAAVIFGIKRFRHYLQDEPFVIISDHRPLQWLQTFKDETGRLGGWSILLANLKYSIKYRPGRVNENADFLSRIPVNSVRTTPEEDDAILRETKKYSLCMDITNYLEHGTLSEENTDQIWAKEIELYGIAGGLLCRTLEPISKKRRRFVQQQVVVPFSLRKQLLNEYHDSPLSGHLAYQRTCLRIRDKYYWPTMLSDVKEYCLACKPCALQRRSNLRAFLNRLDLTSGPFELLGAIVTDRGSNFTSELFSSLCKTLQIKQLRTTAYHPQTNGLTERFNKTVVEMLRKYMEQGFSKWEEVLGPAAFAYRNSVHSSTLETPYFLNHGRDPVVPIDQFLQKPANIIIPSDYKSQLMQRLHEAFLLVKANLTLSREQQRTQYDKRAREQAFNIGDKVLIDVRTPMAGTSKKLIPLFVGPYRVTKINNKHTVEIQECVGKQTQLVHVNRIKPLYESMIWKEEPCVDFPESRDNPIPPELTNELEVPPPTDEEYALQKKQDLVDLDAGHSMTMHSFSYHDYAFS
ncbi:Uncharacterized protein APZ42_025363 [Daphnia magna]|uniref:RNA-directed DNA polymerase n=1 Tax=Daphnia magna TaxID=35525 RepID=A0A164T5G5_9CRUS|nr:Uncharacterized protein APZ42_025363 [Daphnia magna]